MRVSEGVREGVRTSRGVERRLEEGGAGWSRLVGGMQLGPYSCDGFYHAAGLLRVRSLYFGGWDRDWAVSCRVAVVASLYAGPRPVPWPGHAAACGLPTATATAQKQSGEHVSEVISDKYEIEHAHQKKVKVRDQRILFLNSKE